METIGSALFGTTDKLAYDLCKACSLLVPRFLASLTGPAKILKCTAKEKTHHTETHADTNTRAKY